MVDSFQRFRRWGKWMARWRFLVISFWLLLVVLASSYAKDLPLHLRSGTGAIAGTPSSIAERMLADEFSNPFVQSLVVTLRVPERLLATPSGQGLLSELQQALTRHKQVAQVLKAGDPGTRAFKSEDPDAALLLVGLRARDVASAEMAVASVRATVNAICEHHARALEGLSWNVTGRAALTYDINRFSTIDTGRAEARSLPLTAAVLLVAFGSLVAAGVPLFMGIVSIVLTSGLLALLAPQIDLSTYTQSVASMLGLALGIDYALLVVSRFREALKSGEGVQQAVGETVRTAGRAVAISGLTVAIGFAGLLATPVLDSRSMGVGGFLVALVSVTLALTLLPACLALIGNFIDAPRWFSIDIPWLRHPKERWEAWCRWVLKRPWRHVLAALFPILVLSAPVAWLKSGFPTVPWLPRALPYERGFQELQAMGQGGLVAPINLILRLEQPLGHDTPPRKDYALGIKHFGDLLAFSKRLGADSRVAHVLSPFDVDPPQSPMALAMLYANPEQAIAKFPLLGDLFLSHDRQACYFQLILDKGVTFEQSKAFAAELSQSPPRGFEILIGGQSAFFNDFDRTLGATIPLVIAFVVAATFFALAFAFRSVLVPLKAIALNVLSVSAGLGVVVAVFQFGWGAGVFGYPQPLGQIPLTVSLSLFCIVFGLSMDYEVFLLSRIKENYDAGMSNSDATVEAIASTAGIITSAAAIMICVFGAFAWAEFAVVQMLGLGLAVAVLVDASLVRLCLLPALMELLGDKNWIPGGRRQKHSP